LARLYQRLGQFEPAIIRYKLALEINPELCEGWANLATLYTQTNQSTQSQAALAKAKACEPGSSPAIVNTGLKYLKEENYDEAIKEFNKVIAKEPTNELAYFNIGFSYYKVAEIAYGQNRTDIAEKALKQSSAAYESAFKIRPSYYEAAYNTGYNYQTLKDFANAIVWYKKTIAAKSDFAMGYFSLGAMQEQLGDKKAAVSAFCSYLKLNPEGQTQQLDVARSSAKNLGGCP
jgi:tetratricopeptide (TPR) repeat protein